VTDATDAAWEQRLAQAWSAIDDMPPESFVDRIERLVAELPPQHAVGLFERACAQDSTGHPDAAVPLYRAALTRGLSGLRRRRATIQMASSLRNLGQPAQAADLLKAELVQTPSDELDGAVRAFLALALADVGREREALMHALTALSHSLPRYNRSLARYASELVSPPAASG
jgi:tetratricopeptide (TPR) repeat protein